MNKLLCIAGLLLCFSSFGMNEDAIRKDATIKRVATHTSCDKTPTGLMDISAIQREFSQIVVNAIKKEDIEVFYWLNLSLYSKVLNANATFIDDDGEEHTLLSWYISFLKSKMQCMETKTNVDDNGDYQTKLVNVLLEISKGQLTMKGGCCIKRDDPRIKDLICFAMSNQCYEFMIFFGGACYSNQYMSFNGVFQIIPYKVPAFALSQDGLFISKTIKNCVELKYNKKIDRMCFLAKKKFYGMAHLLFDEFLLKQTLDFNSIFTYDIGDGEKKYTPITFWLVCVLKELDGKFSACKLRRQKEYFEDNLFRMANGDGVSKWFIEKKTQGIQKELLILLMNNTKPYNLVYQYYKPLYNDIKKHVAKIRPQILSGYIICIDIIKMMRYYQE